MTEPGRRAEQVEWGLRELSDGYFHKRGHVEPRETEAAARRIIDMGAERRYCGWGAVEVVRRTVVTYTTRWEAAPVSTVPPPLDAFAILAGNDQPDLVRVEPEDSLRLF